MLTLLRNLSIERKLTLIVTVASGVALLLACAAFVVYERQYSRDALADGLMTTARMLGDNSAAALAFGDAASAEQTLKSLAAQDEVVGAAVYDNSGAVFGTYRRSDLRDGLHFSPPPAAEEGARFGENSVEVFSPISVAGERAGSIYIRSTLDEIDKNLWRFGGITLAVLIAATVAAYLLGRQMQKVIAEPLSHLAGVVGLVTREKNYSVRALRNSEDELGRLIDGFNEMLHQIQLRDAALQDARGSLERRVAERTGELQLEIAERQQAELALRSSEERFSSAFEHASIGMALVTLRGRFFKVNRALCDLLDYSADELLARTFQEITHPDDLQADLAQISELLAGGVLSFQMEKRYLGKQGNTIWAQLSVSLVRDARDQPLHFIAQILDINQRKQAEAELEATHKQLVEASRQGGMAEVATNVLHNVGNVLNSVNVSASLVVENVKNSRAASLAKVVALLREHEADLAEYITGDPRGQHIPAFLSQVSEAWLAQQQAVTRELESLRANIDHIKEIVAMQQSYAKISGTTEVIDVRELIEDSVRMNEGALIRHHVRVLREYSEVPKISVEKHKLLQILVNLVRNAKQACDELGPSEKLLLLRVAEVDGRVRISVSDNGAGIAPENLTRIFAHGFTTRRAGHGFGLHSGALAAVQLGGSLSAQSDGPGKGATFTLELPLQPPGARV